MVYVLSFLIQRSSCPNLDPALDSLSKHSYLRFQNDSLTLSAATGSEGTAGKGDRISGNSCRELVTGDYPLETGHSILNWD